MSEATVSGNDRIVEVLHALATAKTSTGVRELAETMGASRSTVNRILQALAEQQLALTTASGAYRVGPRLRVLAAALHARHPLLRCAGEIIDTLAEQTEATVFIALHDAPHPQAVVVACHHHAGPVAYSVEPGTIIPLHAGAAGRAILGRVGLDALGQEPLQAATAETVTDRHELARLLAQDRQANYTIGVGQLFPLAAGAAASFAGLGLTGSISITRPRYSTTDEDLARFGPMVHQAAGAIQTQHLSTAQPTAPPSADPQRAGGTAVERIGRLLTALTDAPDGLPLGQSLARRIGANIATTQRLVATATSAGLALAHDQTLRPGPRLLHWAACLGPARDIPALTQHILRELAESTGETIGLAQLDRTTGQAHMTTVITGIQPLHYGLTAGVPIPLHAGAAGKAILAHCPPDTLDGLDLTPLTERTPTDRQALTRELQAIRDRGWATAEGERIPDALGVSAPYFIDGDIAGSITATIARFRAPHLDLDGLAHTIQHAAQRITQLLTITPN